MPGKQPESKLDFEKMTFAHSTKIRRLSTESYGTNGDDPLATKWIWYWPWDNDREADWRKFDSESAVKLLCAAICIKCLALFEILKRLNRHNLSQARLKHKAITMFKTPKYLREQFVINNVNSSPIT